MGVPIVNFGLSEEYKEEVFGIRGGGDGVEITSPGLVDHASSLAKLGLEEWLEAHGDVLDAVDEAWGNITRIVGLKELGEFLGQAKVAERLIDPWIPNEGDLYELITSMDWKGLIQDPAAVDCWIMVDIFLNEFLPYLEDKVAKMEREVEGRLQVKLEKLSEKEGGGGGSAADDNIEELEDEAIDEYLDELDPDEIQPNDIPDVADAFDELAESTGQFENDLQAAEAEIGSDPEAEEFHKRLAALKQQLVQHNSSLDGLSDRMDGYLRRN